MLSSTVLQAGGIATWLMLLFLILVVVVVAKSVVVLDPHEAGVLTVFGERPDDDIDLEEGINFVPPLVSEVHTFDTRPQPVEFSTTAETADGVAVDVEATAVIRIEDPGRLFEEAGQQYRERIAVRCSSGITDVVERRSLQDALNSVGEVEAVVRERIDREADAGFAVEEVDVRTIERSTEAERERL